MRIGLTTLAFCCSLSLPAAADPLHDGANAFKKEDYKTAMTLLAPLAEAGDGRAECMVTVMRDIASGKSASYAVDALAWTCLAATHGQSRQQLALGEDFGSGFLVKRDDAMAVQLIRLAAENGLPEAQASFGHVYTTGRGVEPDLAQACQWWGRAAAQGGVREAQRNLGLCYLTRTGVPQDDERALFWLGIAKREERKQEGAPLELLDGILERKAEPRDAVWEAVVRRVQPRRLPAIAQMILNWKPVPE